MPDIGQTSKSNTQWANTVMFFGVCFFFVCADKRKVNHCVCLSDDSLVPVAVTGQPACFDSWSVSVGVTDPLSLWVYCNAASSLLTTYTANVDCECLVLLFILETFHLLHLRLVDTRQLRIPTTLTVIENETFFSLTLPPSEGLFENTHAHHQWQKNCNPSVGLTIYTSHKLNKPLNKLILNGKVPILSNVELIILTEVRQLYSNSRPVTSGDGLFRSPTVAPANSARLRRLKSVDSTHAQGSCAIFIWLWSKLVRHGQPLWRRGTTMRQRDCGPHLLIE